MISRSTRIFFDASCLMAAAGSPNGGSGFLLSLCQDDALIGIVSQPVLLEAQRNVVAKMQPEALEAFYTWLQATPLEMASVPVKSELAELFQTINEKDVHVVGAALSSGAHYLISLDKPLITQVDGMSLPLQAYTPGDFIKKLLPKHTDYPDTDS